MAGMMLFIAGIILTGFGVGGVEHSQDNSQLLVSTGVAVLGLIAMYASTILIKAADDNSY
jgi:hypothetical protein